MLIIYGNAGKLTKLGVPQQSKLINSSNIALRSEHTSGDFGVLNVKIHSGEIIFFGRVFEGNEIFVKTFSKVSAAIIYGDEAYYITEISLADAPKLPDTILHMEDISMADYQNKPFPHFAEQPSVAGDRRTSTDDYDRSGFERFNDSHLAMRGNTDVEGGLGNDIN